MKIFLHLLVLWYEVFTATYIRRDNRITGKFRILQREKLYHEFAVLSYDYDYYVTNVQMHWAHNTRSAKPESISERIYSLEPL